MAFSSLCNKSGGLGLYYISRGIITRCELPSASYISPTSSCPHLVTCQSILGNLGSRNVASSARRTYRRELLWVDATRQNCVKRPITRGSDVTRLPAPFHPQIIGCLMASLARFLFHGSLIFRRSSWRLHRDPPPRLPSACVFQPCVFSAPTAPRVEISFSSRWPSSIRASMGHRQPKSGTFTLVAWLERATSNHRTIMLLLAEAWQASLLPRDSQKTRQLPSSSSKLVNQGTTLPTKLVRHAQTHLI